jgi:NAD+ kinase
MMLRAEVWRQEQEAGSWEVLNEAFVGHGEVKRPVHLEVVVDGHLLATYVTDGLIVATPTGSTAYALAAGGPILPPELRNILVVPVAPHLSIDRAIVLAEGSSVEVRLKRSHKGVLSVDGQEPVSLSDGDCVKVCASEHTLRFARLQDPAYFYRNIRRYLNRNPFA